MTITLGYEANSNERMEQELSRSRHCQSRLPALCVPHRRHTAYVYVCYLDKDGQKRTATAEISKTGGWKGKWCIAILLAFAGTRGGMKEGDRRGIDNIVQNATVQREPSLSWWFPKISETATFEGPSSS